MQLCTVHNRYLIELYTLFCIESETNLNKLKCTYMLMSIQKFVNTQADLSLLDMYVDSRISKTSVSDFLTQLCPPGTPWFAISQQIIEPPFFVWTLRHPFKEVILCLCSPLLLLFKIFFLFSFCYQNFKHNQWLPSSFIYSSITMIDGYHLPLSILPFFILHHVSFLVQIIVNRMTIWHLNPQILKKVLSIERNVWTFHLQKYIQLKAKKKNHLSYQTNTQRASTKTPRVR